MKNKLLILFCACAAFGVFAAEPVVKLKPDTFSPMPIGSLKFDGVFGDSLKTAYKNGVMGKDVDMLVYPFKVRNETRLWKGEFWGKWFTSGALAYAYMPTKELDSKLKYATSELIKTQDKQGAIKTVVDKYEFLEMTDINDVNTMTWDLWGRKYVLLGLVAEYVRTSDKSVLEAAKKHLDYIVAHVGEGAGKHDINMIGMWFGVASSSILEPVAQLYQYTGEKKYLDFAEYIVRSWAVSPRARDMYRKILDGWVVTDIFPKAEDPRYPLYRGSGSKAYETTSCFEGVLELYRITGNPDYLKSAEMLADSIRDSEILITGSSSISEKWRRSKYEQDADTDRWQETCVTATWIKFCTKLLRITGNPRYAADIELAAYNAMLAAQKSDGTWWCHYSPLNGSKVAAEVQCQKGKKAWEDNSIDPPDAPKFIMNCCVVSGPRGLFTLPQAACMTFGGGVVFNLYENGSLQFFAGDSSVCLNVSNVNWGGDVSPEIAFNVQKPVKFALKLFVPTWSENTKIFVNGSPFEGEIKAGEYVDISRTWNRGDIVKIDLDARVKIANIPGNSDVFYLKYGSFVLAMDRRFEPNFDKSADIVSNPDSTVNAKPVKVDGALVAFDVPLKDGSTRRFINYSSAGATWSKDSQYTTIFRREGKMTYRPVNNKYKAK